MTATHPGKSILHLTIKTYLWVIIVILSGELCGGITVSICMEPLWAGMNVRMRNLL